MTSGSVLLLEGVTDCSSARPVARTCGSSHVVHLSYEGDPVAVGPYLVRSSPCAVLPVWIRVSALGSSGSGLSRSCKQNVDGLPCPSVPLQSITAAASRRLPCAVPVVVGRMRGAKSRKRWGRAAHLAPRLRLGVVISEEATSLRGSRCCPISGKERAPTLPSG
jgi:hypothetical protein